MRATVFFATAFLGAAFFTAGLRATVFFATAFLGAAFFATAAFFTAGLRATVFFAAVAFGAAFLATGFFATAAFLATGFFAAGFLAAAFFTVVAICFAPLFMVFATLAVTTGVPFSIALAAFTTPLIVASLASSNLSSRSCFSINSLTSLVTSFALRRPPLTRSSSKPMCNLP